jgi:hypothetical protein
MNADSVPQGTPWAQAHGYRHGLALRGRNGCALAPPACRSSRGSVGDWGTSIKPVARFKVARPAEKAGSSVGGESPGAASVQRTAKATLAIRSDSAFERSFKCVPVVWRRRFMEHCPVNCNLKGRPGGEKRILPWQADQRDASRESVPCRPNVRLHAPIVFDLALSHDWLWRVEENLWYCPLPVLHMTVSER